MILYGFLGLIALSCASAFLDWRKGLFAFVVIGLLEDPVRKLVPGTPGFLVLSTTPVWIAILAGMLSKRMRGVSFSKAYPRLVFAVRLFLVSLLPAAAISASYGSGSWMLTILGAFTYLSIIYSALIGYRFTSDGADVRRILGFYALSVSILLVGTALEYLDVPFPALGTEMLGMEWIRQIEGTIVYMVAGFFRSPDIMGWHAVMAAMIALTLALSGKRRWFWIVVTVWAAGLAILCGRRKMVYMLPFFAMAITWVPWQFRRHGRVVSVGATLLVAALALALFYRQFKPDDSFMTYYTHNPGDVYSQIERHGIDSVLGTVRQSGFFGDGLGVASTGAHHLQVERPRVWQESGPSRLMVEVGVPGFIAFLLMIMIAGQSLWRALGSKGLQGRSDFLLWVGIFSMIAANGGAFIVSGQIFGDPFISSILSFLIGVVLSAGRFAPANSHHRHDARRRTSGRASQDPPRAAASDLAHVPGPTSG